METIQQDQSTAKSASVEKLQECLLGELSAVETYKLALKGVTHAGLRHTLTTILRSHARRTETLRKAIGKSQAQPRNDAGVWGSFARAVQEGANLAGNHAAIAALEASEGDGVKLYTVGLDNCDEKTRKLIVTELLPEQRRTREFCAGLAQSTTRRALPQPFDEEPF
jgi:hypothetical protein